MIITPRELLKYAELRDSLVTERASTHPTYASASLDELVSDVRSAAVTAHALATDIVAEFGISESSVLRPDGAFRTGRLIAYIRDPYEPWADSLGLRSQD